MTVKKTNPKLPKSISILGVTFKVEEDPSMPDEEYGETDIEKRLIRMNPKHRDSYLESWWHECFHAAMGVSGHAFLLDEKHEEAIVRMLEHAFSPYLKLPES